MYEKNPMNIENKSMDIIDQYLDDVSFSSEQLHIVKRMIHTTGDVDYRHIIDMHKDFISSAKNALKEGLIVYTDTNMGNQGINKKALAKSPSTLLTLISDESIAKKAKEENTTRSIIAIEEAVRRGAKGFVIGNAPTALFKLLEMVDNNIVKPEFIVAVPVGFVGAAESKEEVAKYQIPYIRTIGTKGGSNVAAAVINALLYMVYPR